MKKFLGLLAVLAIGASSPTKAAVVSFAYEASFNAVNISASGLMQIADTANANGSFEVLGISGTRTVAAEAQTITGTASSGPFSFDNDLFLDAALNSGRYFTDFGLLYQTSAASGLHLVNVFDNFNGTYGQPAGYGESSTPANPAFNPVASVSRLVIQRVPEPATLALVALGLAAAGLLQRRRHPSAATRRAA